MAGIAAGIEGRDGFDRMVSDLRSLDEADDVLRDMVGGDLGPELTLLILSEDARGSGLGRRLFGEACDHLRSRGADAMTFFTDTDCNVGFYDRLGAECLRRTDTVCLGERIGMFVYRYRLRSHAEPGDGPAHVLHNIEAEGAPGGAFPATHAVGRVPPQAHVVPGGHVVPGHGQVVEAVHHAYVDPRGAGLAVVAVHALVGDVALGEAPEEGVIPPLGRGFEVPESRLGLLEGRDPRDGGDHRRTVQHVLDAL